MPDNENTKRTAQPHRSLAPRGALGSGSGAQRKRVVLPQQSYDEPSAAADALPQKVERVRRLEILPGKREKE